ncbi:hypothetical protein [Burkholderia gladioli]|uniref:hypothetical protein n=1 Tax=Burkholderia gladioli TaxID=28095 RepID=UPI00163F2FAD|nr:hypothetical protein [Burkholderia gladioli]
MHSFKDLAAVQLPTSIHSSDTSDLFTQWMAAGGYQQVVGANQFGLTPAQAANTSTIFGLYATQQKQLLPIEDFRFYGGPLMPLAGIYYWIEGRGAPRSMDVRSMNLDMEITDFKPITDIISNREMGPGTYQIFRPLQHQFIQSHAF